MAARLSTLTRIHGVRLREQIPEPGRLWIRYRPAQWPTPRAPWVDLAECVIGHAVACDRPLGQLLPAAFVDDRIYLPPVVAERRAERDALVAALGEEGSPTLVQLLPGERRPPGAGEAVVDLAGSLLSDDPEVLSEPLPPLAPEVLVVWPWVPGVTDRPSLVADGLRQLVRAGVSRVVGLELDLDPGERRRLAEGRDPEVFQALFHAAGSSASDRAFVAAARKAGLDPFVERPAVPGPRAGNRRAAGVLAAIADLWQRLERPDGRGQSYLRAARWADRLETDLEALRREGNLHVLDWVDAEVEQVIEELFRDGESSLLAALRREYAA